MFSVLFLFLEIRMSTAPPSYDQASKFPGVTQYPAAQGGQYPPQGAPYPPEKPGQLISSFSIHINNIILIVFMHIIISWELM